MVNVCKIRGVGEFDRNNLERMFKRSCVRVKKEFPATIDKNEKSVKTLQEMSYIAHEKNIRFILAGFITHPLLKSTGKNGFDFLWISAVFIELIN